jgi:uncharacterized protein (DUF1330 family)
MRSPFIWYRHKALFYQREDNRAKTVAAIADVRILSILSADEASGVEGCARLAQAGAASIMPAIQQGEANMPVYMIVDIQILDPAQYAQYVAQAYEIVVRHGGRYLVRGGKVTPLSGNWCPERVIVIAFDSMEQMRTWLASPEYRAIAPLREQSTISRSIVAPGYEQAIVSFEGSRAGRRPSDLPMTGEKQ